MEPIRLRTCRQSIRGTLPEIAPRIQCRVHEKYKLLILNNVVALTGIERVNVQFSWVQFGLT
jgi:hypothetical protein